MQPKIIKYVILPASLTTTLVSQKPK